MKNVARAFDEQNGGGLFQPVTQAVGRQDNQAPPWATIVDGTMPPMMFELRLHDGSLRSFAYSDVREIRCPDAGHVQLHLYAMQKLEISIEGRHLRDLAHWLGCAMIRWIEEADPRDVDRPEESPEILKIAIQELAD